MGTTYYINRTKDLYGIYVCSKCKSPLLLQFQLLASGASTWSQKKAQEAIEEPCDTLLNALLNFLEKPFLLSKKYNGRTITTGYEVGFGNGDHHCPFCGNHEVWQRGEYYADACKKDPETKVPLIPDCPEESRMIVFTSSEAAVSGLTKLMALKEAELKQYWAQRPQEAEQIRSQIGFLRNQVAALEPQKATVRDKSNYLKAQINEKEAQIKKMSLFSADKKIAKAELKELNTRYSAQLDADILEDRRLAAEIESYEKQIKELKITYPGVLNEFEKIQPKGELAHIVARFS